MDRNKEGEDHVLLCTFKHKTKPQADNIQGKCPFLIFLIKGTLICVNYNKTNEKLSERQLRTNFPVVQSFSCWGKYWTHLGWAVNKERIYKWMDFSDI